MGEILWKNVLIILIFLVDAAVKVINQVIVHDDAVVSLSHHSLLSHTLISLSLPSISLSLS